MAQCIVVPGQSGAVWGPRLTARWANPGNFPLPDVLDALRLGRIKPQCAFGGPDEQLAINRFGEDTNEQNAPAVQRLTLTAVLPGSSAANSVGPSWLAAPALGDTSSSAVFGSTHEYLKSGPDRPLGEKNADADVGQNRTRKPKHLTW